jgi:hypothetical protein
VRACGTLILTRPGVSDESCSANSYADTMASDESMRRRLHSGEPRSKVRAECEALGASLHMVAMGRGRQAT